MRNTIAVALIIAATSGNAPAHSGGTNALGCHTKHATGEYHCHTPKANPPATTWCHVVGGQTRCGYALSTCENLRAKYGGYCTRG